jgi:macrolide-specific efflux system membrane fusion protein
MNPRIPVVPVAIFVGLAVLGLGTILYFQKPVSGRGDTALRAVPVQRADIEETVTAQGKLEPKEYVDVGVQVSGQLKKIHVEIGDSIKTGALIAEIDPAVYEARVAADEAQLKSLRAQLAEQKATADFAEKTLERNRRLIKEKAISQEALDDTQTAAKVAQAKVASIHAQIEQASSALEGDKANLSYTKIYAPMDGTVVSQAVREGRQILPSPETINDVVLYNALVDVDNKDRSLMTGMSTQVFFVVGNAKAALVIPVRALGKPAASEDGKAEGSSYQVRVDNNGTPEERVVQVGLMTRTLAEIKSGLNEGDKILVPETAEKPAGSRQGGGGGRGGLGRTPRL